MDPLFALTEYERAGRAFFSDAVHALMRSKNEIFGSVRTETVASLTSNRVALASGKAIETAPMTMEATFAFSKAATIGGDLDDLLVALDSAAEHGVCSRRRSDSWRN